MKIAVSATGPTLDAEVDPRFGRCSYFVIVDVDTMQFEALENSGAMAGGGAGISAGQMVANGGVQVVLTGNCGPNAYQVLSTAGIQVITGVSGKIRDAIEAYKKGHIQPTSQPTVDAHYGMGRGMGMGAGTMPPTAQSSSPEQELEALKAQSQVMMLQISELQRRIEELEKKK